MMSVKKGDLSEVNLPYLEVEHPANPQHGDYATNVAMVLAAQVKQNPRKTAEIIQNNIVDEENLLDKTQIAGAGFINFFIRDSVWCGALKKLNLRIQPMVFLASMSQKNSN